MAGPAYEYHTLEFYHDADSASALTVLVNRHRYHIIADPAQFSDRSHPRKQISSQYRKLLDKLKAAEEDEGRSSNGTKPVSSTAEDNETKDSGVGLSPDSTKTKNGTSDSESPSKAMKRWMLAPLKDIFASISTQKPPERSVQDWYHCQTRFYDLVVEDGKIKAKEDTEPSRSLSKRMDDLIPSMPLPKYIQQLSIPRIHARDLLVLNESAEIPPYHPTIVRCQDRQYFLKVVDMNQLQPVKREIALMKKIEAKGLHEQFHVPLLRGLVHFGSTEGRSPHIMGFIMDVIRDPKPLTHMLDSNVAEDKRLKWAAESERIVKILHDNGIVWGDAKGDNFMVDADDELWIIDFGGSYTEGWIDPELKETEEGDDMGVERLVNGLKDPDANTVDGHAPETKVTPGKRERAQTSDKDDSTPPAKRRKEAEEDVDRDPGPYCYCNGADYGQMLACDNADCEKEWFHFECAGVREPPAEHDRWFCDDCAP